jgi:drug/metabolite transporter (DMT)-like permease
MGKKENDKYELRGTLLVILTAIISGISIVVNKFFVVRIDPLLLTSLRGFSIGIIFLIISLYFTKINKLNKVKKSSWKYLILIGIIGGGLAFWLFFTGLKITTAGRAAFLQKTLPIYAIILAFIFLKEKITKKQLIAILIMIIGLFLIESTNISYEFRIGNMLVLGATILWAVENTISKKVMNEKENNWVVTFSRMFFGSLLLFSIILISGKTSLILNLNSEQIIYIIISGSLLFLYVFTWYWGLKYINLSKASTILLIAPIISLVLGVVWLNEQIFVLQIIGSLLILIGAFIICRIKGEKRITEV